MLCLRGVEIYSERGRLLIVNVKFGGAVGVNKVSTTCNLLLSLCEREKIPKGRGKTRWRSPDRRVAELGRNVI